MRDRLVERFVVVPVWRANEKWIIIIVLLNGIFLLYHVRRSFVSCLFRRLWFKKLNVTLQHLQSGSIIITRSSPFLPSRNTHARTIYDGNIFSNEIDASESFL